MRLRYYPLPNGRGSVGLGEFRIGGLGYQVIRKTGCGNQEFRVSGEQGIRISGVRDLGGSLGPRFRGDSETRFWIVRISL